MLAHVPENTVEAAYNRAAYIGRRRKLSVIWASLLLNGFPPALSLLDGPSLNANCNAQTLAGREATLSKA